MNIIKQSIKLTLAAALGSLISLAVMAGPGHYEGRLIKALDLTDAQETQLKTLRDSHKADRQKNRDAMKAIQQKKQALLNNYSEQEAENIAQEAAAIFKANMLIRLEHHQALYSMLDDEQKQKFAKILAKHGKGKHRKQGGFKGAMACDD